MRVLERVVGIIMLLILAILGFTYIPGLLDPDSVGATKSDVEQIVASNLSSSVKSAVGEALAENPIECPAVNIENQECPDPVLQVNIEDLARMFPAQGESTDRESFFDLLPEASEQSDETNVLCCFAQESDTIGTIAKAQGKEWSEEAIWAYEPNGLDASGIIYPGQRICIAENLDPDDLARGKELYAAHVAKYQDVRRVAGNNKCSTGNCTDGQRSDKQEQKVRVAQAECINVGARNRRTDERIYDQNGCYGPATDDYGSAGWKAMQ